jgi:hypothetical protein
VGRRRLKERWRDRKRRAKEEEEGGAYEREEGEGRANRSCR